MDDIRYSELLFLEEIQRSHYQYDVNARDPESAHAIRLNPPHLFTSMVVTLLEDLYIKCEDEAVHNLVLLTLVSVG